jgi:Ca-activated chloride channel family protein
MNARSTPALRTGLAALAVVAGLITLRGQQQPLPPRPPAGGQGEPRFKGGVELINVTATVSDSTGRFVPDLQLDDFSLYENDVRQTVTQFSAVRVPVSLGIALDTSGSMAGEKIEAARNALDRFALELLDDRDEMFLYRFSDVPVLLQGWTSDRMLVSHALGRIRPDGGTALYDAVAEAIPLAASGRNQKRALVIISDGNDTSSYIGIRELSARIRQSEVLVYAVGIDGTAEDVAPRRPLWAPPPRRYPPPPIPTRFRVAGVPVACGLPSRRRKSTGRRAGRQTISTSTSSRCAI